MARAHEFSGRTGARVCPRAAPRKLAGNGSLAVAPEALAYRLGAQGTTLPLRTSWP